VEGHAYLWINGKWTGVGPESTTAGTCFDPATGELAGSFADAQEGDVAAAIAAARRAVDDTQWVHSPRLRAQVLLEFAERLAGRRARIESCLTHVNGKLLRESVGELHGAISELRYYAGLARNLFGRIVETEPGCYSNLAREPVGVAGIIVPWNAPVTLLMRSLAPALAAGCTAVVKSAHQTSVATALALECLSEVPGLPPGVVNLFSESGTCGAESLVCSPDVDMVSFTGSNSVGKKIMAAAAGTMKRLSLELGGKSPSIVFPDADIAKAVRTITAASTVMAGQMCTAAARVLVHESVAAEVRSALAASFRAVRVGMGNDPSSEMGPLIDRRSRDRVANAVARAADEGTMHVHGKAVPAHPNGAFLTPSLVEIRDLSSAFIQEEVFGPFLVFETFADEDEAIARANATRYGLAASVWTADRNRAERVSRRLASGTVWINSYNRLFAEAETGGYRESGIGRLHGEEGLNDFLHTKHIYYEIHG
jgi:acyl-CoA reductase-like NAD-dependent aldehyde dehydrogenase